VAGISGLGEGAVEERERGERRMGEGERERKRERGNLSLSLSLSRGRERRREKRGERDDTTMDGRTGRYHTCARTRHSPIWTARWSTHE